MVPVWPSWLAFLRRNSSPVITDMSRGESNCFWSCRTADTARTSSSASIPRSLIFPTSDGSEPDAEVIAGHLETAIAGDSPRSSDELAWAARKLFERIARERPLLVVVDDIQWAAQTFVDLLEHVALLARDAPMLLLCLANDSRDGRMNTSALNGSEPRPPASRMCAKRCSRCRTMSCSRT